MKINITNVYKPCNLCGQGSYIQVEFVNDIPNGPISVRVYKSCIKSIWKTIENVESIPCAKCGNPYELKGFLRNLSLGMNIDLLLQDKKILQLE
jgi:hypothetical protein